MKRSTLLKLSIIPVLAFLVPLLSPQPVNALSCYCNTNADCYRCLNTTEPVACGVWGFSPHTCTWL